ETSLNSAFLAETFGLAGRTALVTGAASGLGFAIARSLGGAGARVVVNALAADACAAAVAQLQATGIEARGAVFSVTDSDAVHAEVAQLQT
ncbi:SDR family NAD(P)-dependent oxidoreductase, partial [Escherichia coli]|uniref:SDR family NAD(P)-dependent oxidoreductase n=1 Tax=Escherichia coli TaxID=562 RepID=UPI0028DE8F59